tara:strand:+ start:198 stop:512 length:315 start_codon:yes stop_codon:yes gene_type:complete
MIFKKITIFLCIFFLLYACGDTWTSVKRGLTGQKVNSTDEFLVKKKDPLTLPPEFDTLPTPNEGVGKSEELSSFEKTAESLSEEDSSSSSSSAESSILKKIRRK